MRCEQVADSLAEVADGTVLLPADAREHVEHCLRCQAELVQYRKLLRALRSLRTDLLEPAPGYLPELLAMLEAESERWSTRMLLSGRRSAYLRGLAAAATAAGVGGAIVLASRTRRPRFPLAG